eukprot:131319-Prorocentrum_minimum.AAC.1
MSADSRRQSQTVTDSHKQSQPRGDTCSVEPPHATRAVLAGGDEQLTGGRQVAVPQARAVAVDHRGGTHIQRAAVPRGRRVAPPNAHRPIVGAGGDHAAVVAPHDPMHGALVAAQPMGGGLDRRAGTAKISHRPVRAG